MNYNNYFYLLLWRLIGKPFFSLSPYLFFKFRVFILKIFGSNICWSCIVYPSTNIYSPKNLTMKKKSCLSYKTIIYNVSPISIGDFSCVSQYTFLCTASHDYEKIAMPLKNKGIEIGKNVWVGADVFIGMGCKIEDNSIIAARSTIFKNVGEGEIVSSTGNHFIIKKRKIN